MVFNKNWNQPNPTHKINSHHGRRWRPRDPVCQRTVQHLRLPSHPLRWPTGTNTEVLIKHCCLEGSGTWTNNCHLSWRTMVISPTIQAANRWSKSGTSSVWLPWPSGSATPPGGIQTVEFGWIKTVHCFVFEKKKHESSPDMMVGPPKRCLQASTQGSSQTFQHRHFRKKLCAIPLDWAWGGTHSSWSFALRKCRIEKPLALLPARSPQSKL